MEKKLKINMTPYEICNSVVLFLIATFIFVSIMWMGGTIVGYGGAGYDAWFGSKKPLIIVSESMTPTIEVNSLLMVENKPYDELKVGDIILFQTRQYGLVIHRIKEEVKIEMTPELEELLTSDVGFKTQGDNNELEDNWVVTSEMYKGSIASIHNEFANIITVLFGDLDQLNFWKLLLGYVIIAFVIVSLFGFIKMVYNYICIYFFLKKSRKKGVDNVIEEYYSYLNDGLVAEKEKVLEIFNQIGKEKGIIRHLKLRYDLMRLHRNLVACERIKRKINYRYLKTLKGLKKNG